MISINDTHIYIEPIDLNLEPHLNLCDAVIIETIKNIASPRRCREIVTTHLMIKRHIGSHVTLRHDANGAPYIDGEKCHISISHCATHVALAVNYNHRIGIDIENWREQLNKVRNRFLSPNEQETINTPQLLLQAWTAKEALYKVAQSPGISLATDIILPTSNNPMAQVSTPTGIAHFTLTHITPSPQQHLTLAEPVELRQ